MKLSELYAYILRFGRERDPRGKKRVRTFEDSALLYGSPETRVTKLLVGIDIDAGELLIADRLRNEGRVDCVLSHHPDGGAWAAFYGVMALQSDVWGRAGIDSATVEGFLSRRVREVARKVHSHNHMRAVDAARLLDIPFICSHTPADNQVNYFLQQLLNQNKPEKISDLVELLHSLPEYGRRTDFPAGPRVITGGPGRRCGKILVDMTGGAEGPKQLIKRLIDKGIGTVVCMHISEDIFNELKGNGMNVVVAGHISSDTLGMNLLLDRIESVSGERFDVVECSGFRRVKRI